MKDLTEEVLPNASCVFILYKDDKVLLHLRDDKAPTNPNTWALFGGGIDEEETPTQCVVREAKEELNYTLTNPTFLLVSRQDHKVFEFEHVFFQEYDNQPLTLQEGADIGWFSKDELPNTMRRCQRLLVQLLFTYLEDKELITYTNKKHS